MAPLFRDRAGTAALANRATHFALSTREAARGGDTDRPSGLPRHGGGPGDAHGRAAVPRRRQRHGGRLCRGIHARHGGGPGEAHAARQPASPARVHGADVPAPERPTADRGGVREPTSMTTRESLGPVPRAVAKTGHSPSMYAGGSRRARRDRKSTRL